MLRFHLAISTFITLLLSGFVMAFSELNLNKNQKMPFNSLSFVFFFFLFTVLYYCSENVKIKSVLLLTGSYVFYAYANIFNLFFLLSTTFATYIVANKLIHSRKHFLLLIGISFILIQLLFAKYSSTYFSDYAAISTLQFSYFNLFILPIGISFYSLQAISLLVDIRSGKYKGDTSLKGISQFLSFFPQSISGPIHRASELIPQFSTAIKFDAKNLILGFKTMLWGYFCKLVIADKIALIVTPVFTSYHEFDSFAISIAALLYSFQIYFDFWGYSLIAIGVGKTLGFTININFLNPYSSKSFKEFWHRWHITLSRWMRDYIYIPLGGKNQKRYLLFCLSILVTFLVSGFWHGASFNFVLWGATHAFLYLAEDFILRQFSFNSIWFYNSIIQPLRTILFFILISYTWLVFRTDNIYELASLLKSIVLFPDWTSKNVVSHYYTTTNILYLAIALITFFFTQTNASSRFTDTIPVTIQQKIFDSIITCICLITVILLGDIGRQEFLYFRF